MAITRLFRSRPWRTACRRTAGPSAHGARAPTRLCPRASERAAVSLYTADGRRKYLNAAERARALFALTLAWTGARISEVLALTPLLFQIDSGIVALRTLKRRRFVMREIPIPPSIIAALEQAFDLAAAQHDAARAQERLFCFSRTTAWRIVKRVMARSGIAGCHACPKAFRHAFGVGTLQASIPINLTQRWLGHARLTTTAIYAAACGPDEIAFAARFWHSDGAHPAPSNKSDKSHGFSIRGHPSSPPSYQPSQRPTAHALMPRSDPRTNKRSSHGAVAHRRPGTLDRIIAQNIRRYRLARGLTQQALAAAIGVTFQQLS